MKCQVPQCGKRAASRGLCSTHYSRMRLHGTLDTTRPRDWGKRNKHPLNQTYRWIRQRTKCGIVDEWQDFWRFVDDVGERPSPKHTIRRIDETKPYGPDNFFWKERLASSQSAKDYQRAFRRKNPLAAKSYELKRGYGITIDDYHDILEKQGGVCAICGKDNNGRYKFFAVDHCHKENKVRGLLCGDCNTGIGLFKEDREIFDSAKKYLGL